MSLPAEFNPLNPWNAPQKILVILAHPDDPEFFCGGTLSAWAQAGHQIHYCLLTCGDKGSDDRSLSGEDLCKLRHQEQQAAAQVIGVAEVCFLNQPDGYIVPDLALRREVTRQIRLVQPDILVTCDPTYLFGMNRINHPDHRAAGQVVLDAVFPAAGNHRYFPDLLDAGLEPHTPREIWVSLAVEADTVVNITPFWEQKLSALQHHRSQIGDPEKFVERMRSRHTADTTLENPRYEERFRIIRLG